MAKKPNNPKEAEKSEEQPCPSRQPLAAGTGVGSSPLGARRDASKKLALEITKAKASKCAGNCTHRIEYRLEKASLEGHAHAVYWYVWSRCEPSVNGGKVAGHRNTVIFPPAEPGGCPSFEYTSVRSARFTNAVTGPSDYPRVFANSLAWRLQAGRDDAIFRRLKSLCPKRCRKTIEYNSINWEVQNLTAPTTSTGQQRVAGTLVATIRYRVECH